MRFKDIIIVIFISFSFQILFNCAHNETKESYYEEVIICIENEEKEINEILANKCMYPILDSLIVKQNILTASINENTLFFMSLRIMNNDTILGFELRNLRRFYCEFTDAILIYKSHLFIYRGDFTESLFTKTNRKRKIRCRKSDFSLYDIDDSAYFIRRYKTNKGIVTDYE
jgi:hypothetical protein